MIHTYVLVDLVIIIIIINGLGYDAAQAAP